MKSKKENLTYQQKIQGWNRSVNFLLHKHRKTIEALAPQKRKVIYKDLAQAACDYWFGKNVYKVLTADYVDCEFTYGIESASNVFPLFPVKKITRKKETKN